MPTHQPSHPPLAASLEAYLLGQVDFDASLALQQRLVYEAAGADDGRVTLLVCEHKPTITLGRQGSRVHVRCEPEELTSRQIDVRWVNRGGGCVLHGPGQLAIYAIVPLEYYRLSVGAYLDALHAALAGGLDELKISARTLPGRAGLWGRQGQLAHVGVAVKNWVTYFGAYLNVAAPPALARRVQTDPVGNTPASSLVAERQQPVRIASVRERLVRHFAEQLGIERWHLYTHHPLLAPLEAKTRDAARAG